MNHEMVAQHVPALANKPFAQGTPFDDGLGITLGVSADGHALHMDQAFLTAPFYPPGQLLTGIIVNRGGRHFVAEDSYHSRTSGFVRALGIPAGHPAATLQAYNLAAARGEDPECGKQSRLARTAGHRTLGSVRPYVRQGHVRGLHPWRAAVHS